MDFGLMLSSHGWKSPGYYYDGNYNPSAGEKPDKPSSGYTSDNKCTPYYLNIPIHIGYKFPVGRNVSLFINAGPYFNIGLFGKAKETITPDKGTATTKEMVGNVFSERCLIASIGGWDSVPERRLPAISSFPLGMIGG